MVYHLATGVSGRDGVCGVVLWVVRGAVWCGMTRWTESCSPQ